MNFNPLGPKRDQHQIFPCNINAIQNKVVTRIKDMIKQDESTSTNNSPHSFHKKLYGQKMRI